MNPVDAFMRFLTRPAISNRMWVLPSPPRILRRRYASPRAPWSVEIPHIPAELLTVPGNRRDSAAEQEAFAAEPLQNFHEVHAESIRWEVEREWASFLPVAPRLARAERAVRGTWRHDPPPPARAPNALELTGLLKRRARELGFGAVGIARYDPKYTFVGDAVIRRATESWSAHSSRTTARPRRRRASARIGPPTTARPTAC